MLGSSVIANGPEDQAPNYPIVRFFRVLVDGFLDFLHGFGHLPLFEQGESPMSIAIMVIRVVLLGKAAHSDGLVVVLVHVVDEC